MSGAVPAWKLALLERKKRQEEDEKAKKEQAEEAKLASLPAWKRAILLREKQGIIKGTSCGASNAPPPASSSSSDTAPSYKIPQKSPGKGSNKWQVAVERVKGPDSPILHQKLISPSPSTQQKPKSSVSSTSPSPSFQQKPKSAVSSTSPSPSFQQKPKSAVSSTSPSPSFQQKPKSAVSSTSPSPSFQQEPKSAKSPSSKATKNQVINKWKPSDEFSSPAIKKEPVAVVTPKPATKVEDDPSLEGLPAWKKALILKKRKVLQPQASSEGQDEPDSANTEVEIVETEKSNPVTPTTQPQVVNRGNQENSEDSGLRLVEREGKTLHPPIYKEVDEWADVKEEDNKFKNLPLWKQALIKRRRADIAKRSGLPVTITPTLPPVSAPTTLASIKENGPASPISRKQTTPQWKKKQPSSNGVHKSSAETKKASTKTTPTKSEQSKQNRSSNRRNRASSNKGKDVKPARKAPAPPAAEKEEMFTYNFSKSSRHTLDTGGSSSDSTDSDLEDAIITNLDDDSDEADSGIVLQHYSAAKQSTGPSPSNKSTSPRAMHKSVSSPNLGQKSLSDSLVKSALTTSGKKRRVSAHYSL